MLRLKEASMADADKEWRFVRDMPEDENGLTNAWHGVPREAFMRSALPSMLAWARGEGLPEGYVPETVFFLWKDSDIVGQFSPELWASLVKKVTVYGKGDLRFTLASGAEVRV